MDAAIKALPDTIKGNKDAVAETIENNVRSKIVKEHLNDPNFYEKMSKLIKQALLPLLDNDPGEVERHGERFVALMNRLMPNWRDRRDALNRLPVRNEHWVY